jgi:alpha-galactosidase
VRMKLTGAALALAGSAFLASSTAPASAAVFTVGSLGSPSEGGGGSVCMDVNEDLLTPGNPVIAFHCHASGNQQFEFSGKTIYAMGGTRCINVKGALTAAGTPIDSFTCNGHANQVWVYDRLNAGSIRNPVSGLCLDATTMADHVVLVINPCNGSAGQTWQIK